jgi:hypothetical protein
MFGFTRAHAQVRGYLPVDPKAGTLDTDFSAQQAAIADLTQRKQELLYELTSYQNTRSSQVQVRARTRVCHARNRCTGEPQGFGLGVVIGHCSRGECAAGAARCALRHAWHTRSQCCLQSPKLHAHRHPTVCAPPSQLR